MRETAEAPPQVDADSGGESVCPDCEHDNKKHVRTRLQRFDAWYLRTVFRQRPSCGALLELDETGWGGSVCICENAWHVVGT